MSVGRFLTIQVLVELLPRVIFLRDEGDIGKPTTKLEKAAVRDGTCIWDNPVYETVKFVQESKTGKISDRIYHFVVSTGLPKASPIGEVSINFADYVETTKPSSVSLPIRISHCDVVLHFLLVRQ
ncbi:hypothetical protein VIGAN_05218700 [Vigna angularis var. angularis]|uniref:C2 NT-type domain-containing protein n=1 Tax=Vigna angularis var. angularis TaxID=157739 RepID=A0A0S3S746_PHAAN|nr:hypothetical protein VIGAN_05218700 [Vigna angularis var. angularis]